MNGPEAETMDLEATCPCCKPTTDTNERDFLLTSAEFAKKMDHCGRCGWLSIPRPRYTHQPLAVPLDAVAVEVDVLDGDLLLGEAGVEAVVDRAPDDGVEVTWIGRSVGGSEQRRTGRL